MSALACLFGLHSLDTVRVVEIRGGRMVVVAGIRCARCGARIAEEVTDERPIVPGRGDGQV